MLQDSEVCSIVTLATPGETLTVKCTIHSLLLLLKQIPETFYPPQAGYGNMDFATQPDANVQLAFLSSTDHKIWYTRCCWEVAGPRRRSNALPSIGFVHRLTYSLIPDAAFQAVSEAFSDAGTGIRTILETGKNGKSRKEIPEHKHTFCKQIHRYTMDKITGILDSAP